MTERRITTYCARHRRTQDYTMEGVHVMGAGTGGLRDGSPPVEFRGKAPVWGRILQKLKENVKIACNFNVFVYKM